MSDAKRWTDEESKLLADLRERLGEKLTSCPQYPEVVGDRKMIRFIRGHNHDLDKACEMVEKFLAWRIKEGVDEVRKDIVENKLDHPSKFPKGPEVLKVNPLMVLNATAIDNEDNFVSAEGTIPPAMWEDLTPEEYVRFRIYCLEYITLCLEKKGDEREAKALEERMARKSDDETVAEEEEPYGCLEKLTVIRNVAGLSMSDFAGKNRETAGTLMKIASDNYPELLKKYYVVNAPWVFTGIFTVLKVFLAQKTIDKIKVMGSGFMSTVNELVPISAIPDFLGGQITVENLNTEGDFSGADERTG